MKHLQELLSLAEASPDKNGIMPLSYKTGKGHKIEAYGVKGMQSKQWRKSFKDEAALEKWCDDNDATVHGVADIKEAHAATRWGDPHLSDGPPPFAVCYTYDNVVHRDDVYMGSRAECLEYMRTHKPKEPYNFDLMDTDSGRLVPFSLKRNARRR